MSITTYVPDRETEGLTQTLLNRFVVEPTKAPYQNFNFGVNLDKLNAETPLEYLWNPAWESTSLEL